MTAAAPGLTRDRLIRIGDQALRLCLTALLIAVPLVFYTQTYDVFETNKITVFRLLTLLAALALAGRWLVHGRFDAVPSALYAPLAAVGLSSLLSTLITNNAAVSWFGVYEDYEGLVTIANYLLLFVLVQQAVRRFDHARPFVIAILLAGGLSAAYGVLQNFGIDFVLWNPSTYSASRLFGTLGNPNFLAAYLLMALPLALFGFLSASGRFSKTVLGLLLGLMLVCIVFTKSRGAVYALAAEALAAAAYLIYDARRQGGLWRDNRRWVLLLGLLLGATLLLPNVRSSLVTAVTRTLATLNVREIKITPRLYIWRSALQMIRDHPVTGAGLDTFQITFPKYRLPEYWRLEWNGTPEKAHNFFLQIGATTGLLGLGAWGWLLVAFFILMARQLRGLDPPQRHLTAAIMTAQLGFLVQNQFNFTVIAYGSLFFFYLALGPALARAEAPAPAKPEPWSWAAVKPGEGLIFLGVAALLVVGLAAVLRAWSADVFFKRGIVALTSGYPDRAIDSMAQSVRLAPQREIYWVKYGIAHEELAKRVQDKAAVLKRAAEIHQHTIGMNPLNGYDFNNLGRVYKYWGDYLDPAKLDDAERACRRATELDPYNVYFALDLASVYLSQKRWDEAAAVARRLTELFPDFAVPYSYLGYVALVRNDYAAASLLLDRASQSNWRGDVATQASTWSNLGIVRARRSELEGSAEAFRAALALRPEYLEARLNLGVVLERLGRTGEALAEYRRIVADAPGWPQAQALTSKIENLERRTSR